MSRPLTILQYITPSRLGGAEDYFLRLISSLRAAGHRVLVVTKRDTPLRALVEQQDVELHPWLTHGKVDPATLAKLCRLIRAEKVDVIHTHLTTASLLGSMAGKLTRVPVVAHVHATDSKTFFQFADYLVGVADGVRRHLIDQGVPARKIQHLDYGVDLQRFNEPLDSVTAKARLGLPPDALTCGVVGHFSPRKGHRFLLQALHDLRAEFSKAQAVFAGEGALRDELEAQTLELGMSERVHFLGFRTDVAEVVAALDLFVLPSLKEGLPISIMEAMALHRPVVSTTVSGIPEVVVDGETGLLVPPADTDALAAALRRLLADRELRERMGLAGRHRIETHYDQRQCLPRVEAFLQQVVGAWPRRLDLSL